MERSVWAAMASRRREQVTAFAAFQRLHVSYVSLLWQLFYHRETFCQITEGLHYLNAGIISILSMFYYIPFSIFSYYKILLPVIKTRLFPVFIVLSPFA